MDRIGGIDDRADTHLGRIRLRLPVPDENNVHGVS